MPKRPLKFRPNFSAPSPASFPPLLAEDEAMLALGAAPAVPSPDVKARLMARVRAQSVSPVGWRFDSVRNREGWTAAPFPGVRFKMVAEDAGRDTATVLVELAAGATFPDHVHPAGGGAEEMLVISGDLVTGGRLHHGGDYIHAAPGSEHHDTWSSGGCVAVMFLSAKVWAHARAAMGLPMEPKHASAE